MVTRHEEKMKPVEKVVPGSAEDQRLPLSMRGKQNAYRTGQDPQVVPPSCDLVIAARSTLMRTTETLQHMLSGAGYDVDSSVVQWQPERAETGLACGFDFSHPELPKYDPAPAPADAYVKTLLTDYFVPCDGDKTRPVMAAMGAALLDSMISGIEQALPCLRNGGSALFAQATHAPFIDALDAVLFDTVNTDIATGCNTLENWPGHYAMGEYVVGGNCGPIENFSFLVQGKSIEGRWRTSTFSLDDLKRRRDVTGAMAIGKLKMT